MVPKALRPAFEIGCRPHRRAVHFLPRPDQSGVDADLADELDLFGRVNPQRQQTACRCAIIPRVPDARLIDLPTRFPESAERPFSHRRVRPPPSGERFAGSRVRRTRRRRSPCRPLVADSRNSRRFQFSGSRERSLKPLNVQFLPLHLEALQRFTNQAMPSGIRSLA